MGTGWCVLSRGVGQAGEGKSSSKVKKPMHGRGQQPLTAARVLWCAPVAEHRSPVRRTGPRGERCAAG